MPLASGVEPLDDRDREGERLAGAGRALREDVAAAERLGDRGGLDGERRRDALLVEDGARRHPRRRARGNRLQAQAAWQAFRSSLYSFLSVEIAPPASREPTGDAISLESRIALHVPHGSSGVSAAVSSAGCSSLVEPVLDQPQPVLELGDAQVELVPVVARDQPELVEDRVEAVAASPRRSASRRRASASSPRRRASGARRASARPCDEQPSRGRARRRRRYRGRPCGLAARRWRLRARASLLGSLLVADADDARPRAARPASRSERRRGGGHLGLVDDAGAHLLVVGLAAAARRTPGRARAGSRGSASR